MASNYTTNYELPLWAADDAFLRTEFNDAHEKIEDALTETAENIPKIAVGSYVGDGRMGFSNSIQIEIGFAARLVLIMRESGNSQATALFLRPCKIGAVIANGNCAPGLTWTSTGVSWCANDIYGAGGVMNEKNTTYHWWAIG